MKYNIYIVIAFSLLPVGIFAQTNSGGKLSFSFSSGLATPTGIFGNSDIGSSVVYDESRSPDELPFVFRFNKSKSGFANLGYYFAGQLNYHVHPQWFILMRAAQTTNSVNTEIFTTFFNDLYTPVSIFQHDDYTIFTSTLGMGYNIKLDRWEIKPALMAGWANTNYPYYANVYSTGENLEHTWTWAHTEERPDLQAFTGGGLLQVAYQFSRLSIGLEIIYQIANFDYEIAIGTFPGGNRFPAEPDQLKTSLLNTGLRLQYTFGKKSSLEIAEVQ